MISIISGRFKKRKLATPRGTTTRPTLGKVRETLFNICQQEIEDATFLDLFAGAGTIGFEALSRGARFVTFVESDRFAIQAIEENIKQLQVKRETRLIKQNVFKALEGLPPADLIFADPPYGQGFGERLLELAMKHSLVKSALFIEEDHELPTPKGLELLSCRKMGRTYLHHWRVESSC